jgi:hypothetical protein
VPQTGKDYPGSYAELLEWFPDEAACLDYLEWLRCRTGSVARGARSGLAGG